MRLRLFAISLVAAALAGWPAAAQTEERCALDVGVLEAVVDGEGTRAVLFAEHLELLRESRRRGEERLCLDLAEDLRDRLSEGEA